jgi:uncharacterized protein (DUF58 family)
MTPAIQMAVIVGLTIAAVGALTSRVDVVLLALPLLASAAIGFDAQPRPGEGGMHVDVTRRTGPGGVSEFGYAVAIEAPARTELVHVRIAPQGSRVRELVLTPMGAASITGRLPVVHSGRQVVVEVSYRLIGVDGGWLSPAAPWRSAEHVIDPAIAVVASVPLPQRLSGLTGSHLSARLGDGGEFRDLHPYAPGDRLRRIDWKATARRSQGFGDPYVRRTGAMSDATIVLVLDSRDDVGERIESWSIERDTSAGLSSMDLAREAAASLAVAAIGGGDRVSLIDLAVHDGLVTAGSGKRHLDRLLRRIAVSGPIGFRPNRRRAPIVPAGAIVYLFSPFLDDDVTAIAKLWRAAGHRVVAVDVLPAPLLDGCGHHTRIVHRLMMAERRLRIADARASGIEMLRWQEGAEQPSRSVALRTIARAGQRRR